MLIRFRVENFRSIREEQEMSLVASAVTERDDAVVRRPSYDFGVLRTAAVYGANASGKSTLCNALQFMQAAVTESHRSWKPEGGVPHEPFALDEHSLRRPSSFSVDLLLDGIRYEYGFVADASRIREEWLFAYPKGRRQEWFTRDASREDEFTFSRLLAGENRTIRALTRPNSLFLSAAAQNNHEMLAPVHGWFAQMLRVVDPYFFGALSVDIRDRCADPGFRAQVFAILRAADLGLSGIELVDDEEVSAGAHFVGNLLAVLGSAEVPGLRLLHRAAAGEDVALPFAQESGGTRTLFALAGAMVQMLPIGGTLVVDELDRSLHPHLLRTVVDMFNSAEANPRNAQLIFNTHDTNLLSGEILRRDQIWFTEKGEDGATHLFPLTDFRARKLENLERGYLQGRYGAVPSVRTPERLGRTAS